MAASNARARAIPAFELELGGAQAGLIGLVADWQAGRKSGRAGEIERAAREAQVLDSAVGQARWQLQDIRRRAGWIDPRRGRDWFFEADVQRFRRTASDLERLSDELDRTVARLARETEADPSSPELAEAAGRLVSAARGLRLESGRLADDGRWARHELGRAGLSLEGSEIERGCSRVLMNAFNVEHAAKRLARKVTP